MSNWDGKNKKFNQTPEERRIMLNRYAHLVSIGGSEMEEKLKFSGYGNPLLSFVFRADPDHALYKQMIAEYIVSPPPPDPTPTPTPTPDPPSSLGRYRVPSPYTFVIRIPQGMMRKELGVIKFTAQFMARYGYEFGHALLDRGKTQTQFQFMKESDGMHILFTRIRLGYVYLIKTFVDMPRKNDTARMEAVLEGFSAAFIAFKKKQEEAEEDGGSGEVCH